MAEERAEILRIEVDIASAQENLKRNIATIEANKQVIKQLTDEITVQRKAYEKAREQYNRTQTALQKGEKTVEDLIKAQTALTEAQTEYNRTVEETALPLNGLAQANAKLAAENRVLNQQIQATPNSLNDLRTQLKLALKEYDNFAIGVSGTEADFTALTQRIQGLTEKIQEQEQATGRFQRNVGNYKSALSDVVGGVEAFSGQAAQLIGLLRNVNTGLKQSGVGFKSFGSALKGGALGGILAVIGAISTFISKTQEGRDEVGDFSARIQGAVNALIAVFAKLGGAIVGSIGLIVNAVKQLEGINFTNFSEKFAAVSQSIAKDSANVGKSLDGLSESITNVFSDVAQSSEAEAALRRLGLENEKLRRATELFAADLRLQQASLQQAAEDSTLSLRQQAAEAERLGEVTRQVLELELTLRQRQRQAAEENLKIREALQNATAADRDALLEAQKAEIEAQAALNEAIAANATLRRQILSDEIELELDVLIDGFDAIKSVNERRLQDENLTFEERKRILEETTKEAQKAFDAQIEALNRVAKEEIKGNELLAQTDAKRLNELIRNAGLSETLQTRLLEAVRERKAAEQDLIEAGVDLTQAELEQQQQALQKLNEANIEAAEIAKKSEAEITQLKLKEINDRYAAEFKAAKNNKDLILALETAKANEINKLNKGTAQVQGQSLETQKQQQQAFVQSLNGFLTAISVLIAQNNEQIKGFAFVQATASYVQELQNLGATTSAPTNSPNLFTFGAAGAAAYALQASAATARYFSNIALLNKAAGGGDFVTTKPTLLLVGDNPGGRERVTVEPLSGRGKTVVQPNSGLVKMAGGGSVSFGTRQNLRTLPNVVEKPVLVLETLNRKQRSLSLAESRARL